MKQQASPYGRTAGFTLIELLVVLGIVAGITAILLPVFAKARGPARIVVCTSNLHQVALALQMYAHDYDSEYPLNYTSLQYEWRQKKRLAWALLTPYTRDPRIFHCPDAIGASKVLGYEYRIEIGNDPSVVVRKPLRPGSGTVVASCEQHTERMGEDGWDMDGSGHVIGPLIVAREDGSVSRIMGDQVQVWAYASGQWYQYSNSTACPTTAALCMVRYPGEEWPPHL